MHTNPIPSPSLPPSLSPSLSLGDMMGEKLMRSYFLPWLVGMPAETSLAMCSLAMGGVLERLPTLRVCFAHGGGAFPATLGRIEHGWAVRPDLCQSHATISPGTLASTGRMWVDSLVHEPHALADIVRIFGPDRVCLGSDYPFPLGSFTAESGGTDYVPLELFDVMASRTAEWGSGWAHGGDIREKVLGGAALQFLDKSASHFR